MHLPHLAVHPPTQNDIEKIRKPIRNVNAEYDEKLSRVDRLAMMITDRVGTMGFFFIIFVWTVFWLVWNFLAPKNLQFDPPMAFVFWLFISNMIQILLMPLIMVGQNLQGRHAEKRAESDFEINIKAEKEVDALLQHLEYQNAMLRTILIHMGIAVVEEESENSGS